MKQVLVDSGGWYAVADKRDPDHGRAVSFLKSNSLPLITTNFIFDEAITLMRSRMGWQVAVDFGKKLLSGGVVTIAEVRKEDEERAWEIFLRFKDQDFSYTDCTSFAVMERLRLETAFTFDEHFRTMKFHVVPEKQ